MRVKVKMTGQVGELIGFNVVMMQPQTLDPRNLGAPPVAGPPQPDALCLVAIEDKFVLISGGALEPIYDEPEIIEAELKETVSDCCLSHSCPHHDGWLQDANGEWYDPLDPNDPRYRPDR